MRFRKARVQAFVNRGNLLKSESVQKCHTHKSRLMSRITKINSVPGGQVGGESDNLKNRAESSDKILYQSNQKE